MLILDAILWSFARIVTKCDVCIFEALVHRMPCRYVDLGGEFNIHRVVVTGRTEADNCKY